MNEDVAGQMCTLTQAEKPRVAIQGGDGSFHQIIAHQTLGQNIEIVPCATFREAAAKAESGEADVAVMAIENSIAGSILPNYKILQRGTLKIVGEAYLHIRQQLMANPGVALEEIREVHSHPMALQQCAEYLDEHPWRLVETNDTAMSAKHLAETGARNAAAIASTAAAELYGMEIIAPDIHTIKNNYTRFLILAPSDSGIVAHGADKASIYFKTNHEQGTLLRVLKAMENSDMNLTKLQSYPIPSEPWHYMFHVDMEFGNVESFIRTLDAMRAEAREMEVYGIYKKGLDHSA
ncbi:prephenate dehydratase [Alistipes sp. OttesenSCG-928-L06]|nr:prephenate dehydratase [Alistipes sp. OttesenSCG-928-L06]